MMYGLKENVLKKIQDVFTIFPQMDTVILYGSRAKGNYKNGSDIDITFKGKNLSSSLLNKISLQLDDLYLPYTFDLSIYNQIDNEALLDHINRIGIDFYSKK